MEVNGQCYIVRLIYRRYARCGFVLQKERLFRAYAELRVGRGNPGNKDAEKGKDNLTDAFP